MDLILVILIACAAGYLLGFRLGVGRGRKESRLKEYRRGYRQGIDHARKDFLSSFNQHHPEARIPRTP
jgi:hypothetical protein